MDDEWLQGGYWKQNLYLLQEKAPRPILVRCNRRIFNCPDFYGDEFHGLIERSEAEMMLKNAGEGSYLVRASKRSEDAYTLCIMFDNNVLNYKLFYDGMHYVGEKRFETVELLVADGLISMFIDKHASEYIKRMADEAIYEQSPYSQYNRNDEEALQVRAKAQKPRPHNFNSFTFKIPHYCDFCRNFMWGLVQQGVRCMDCGFAAHKKCSEQAKHDCRPEAKYVKRMFAVDLSTLCMAHSVRIPPVLVKCIDEVERRGIDQEGIYRVSGSHEQMEKLRRQFDLGINVELSNVEDIHTVCGLLKLYLRLLPQQLVPYPVFRSLLQAFSVSTDQRERTKNCRNLASLDDDSVDQPETPPAEDDQQFKPENHVFEDRITIYVEPDNGNNGSVQMCPAIFIPNNSSISSAVKHIYSRLSANATELDQGIPDIMLSLIPTTATFNLNTKEKLTKGLGKVVSHCGLWLVMSGEQIDPLSSIATSVVKTTLPTSDLTEETLVIVANTVDVAYRMNSTTTHYRIQPMTDTSINTYYFVFNRRNLTMKQKHEFRSLAAIKLANPPPALLIGVPVETSSGSTAQTPSGSNVSPAIILPNSVKYDRRPLSASVFCGESLTSIYELKVYLDCGVPCLIVHDVSDLCALLRTCHVYYQSANFDHENFINWLQCELRTIMGSETDINIEEIQEAICQCMQLTMGGHSLLHFVNSDDIDNLPEHIIELLMRCAESNEEYRQIMNLAVKLNISSVLTSVQITALFNEEQFESLLVDALCRDSRINVVDALISIQPFVHVTPRLLMQWLDATIDQDFFNIVVVGQCLGYSNKLYTFTEYFANDLDYLLYELAKGFANLFPAAYFSQPNISRDKSTSIQILAIWALCLNRVELVKCLWAHSPEPLSLALILSRIAKSLAFEAREFFFYEEQLTNLSKFLTKAASTLLDQAYLSSPRPAYQTLCRKLPYNNQTLSSLAFATNNKEFIAHECCQRWVLRLLYGNLQFGQIFPCINFPKWLKIIFSAILIFPVKIWVSIRPPNSEYFTKFDFVKPMSPTVALLETGRPVRRVRTHSTHSTRSFFHREEGSIVSRDDKNYGGNTAVQMGIETPKSVVANAYHSTNDETDAMLQNSENHIISGGNRSMTDFAYRRKTTKKMNRTANFLEFYRTPIVKYWLSLVSRLVYLAFFAYTVALPGCGNTTFDVILWIWTCFWLLDNVWVIHCRSCYGQLSNMPWTIFDAILIAFFLVTLMICEATGHLLMHYISFPSAYFVKVIWGCLLLYQCYATLFLYIPLSDLFGPLMVRIKLMITRDFVNFLILVSLLICSSAIAMKAIVYPDLEASPSVIKDSLSWAWMSLFTTDLSALEQTIKCKSSLLPSNSRDYCTSVGGYGNPKCPSNGSASFMVIIEYLIILKLIAWPILFALFSKTAKEVDEEADKIWKYQLYGLATNFSYRLMFPPPFTPIALLFYACCGEKQCLSGIFMSKSFTSVDHPDVYKPSRSIESNQNSPSKFSVIYQNPSVPQPKYDPTRHFYCQAAIDYWKKYSSGKEKVEEKLIAFKKQMEEKMHYLIVASSFNVMASQSESTKHWNQGVNGDHHRIIIHPKFKSWNIMLPDYNPPEYSKPVQEYAPEMQKYVDHATPHNLSELTKHWKQKKLHELLTHEKHILRLSVTGLPLNPSGRTGLGGRGTLIRFGPNRLIFYIIFAKSPTKQLMVLTTNENDLPSKPKYDHNRADDFLSKILTMLGVPDGNVQILSTRGHLLVGQVDNCVAHVCTQPLPLLEDTDNAWTEADVWAINLTQPSDYQIQRLLTDFKWQNMPTTFVWPMRVEFIKHALQSFSLTGN